MADPLNAPALSATSDMPQVEPVAADPVPPSSPPPAPPSGDGELKVDATTQPPASPHPVAARISELTGERRRLEQLVQQTVALSQEQSAQIKALLERIASETPTPAPASVSVPDQSQSLFSEARPSRDQFGDPESYETALVDWSARRASYTAAAEMRRQQEELQRQREEFDRQEQERRLIQENQARQNREIENIRNTWDDRQKQFAQGREDYYNVISNPDLPVTLPMLQVILSHERGPEIAYFLGKNLDEARRISMISVPGELFPAGHPQAGLPVPNSAAQAFELGQIVARLDQAAPAAPISVPAANVPLPTPPSPINGSNASAGRKSPEEETMEEYAARRTQELRQETRPWRH